MSHDVHHLSPEFWLGNATVPFDELNQSGKVVDLSIVSKSCEYFGEAWFERGD
jgi:hypothetical protein